MQSFNILFFFFLFLLIACTGPKVLTTEIPFQAECIEGLYFNEAIEVISLDSIVLSKSILESLNQKSLDIAHTLGVIPEVELLVESRNDSLRHHHIKTSLTYKVMRMQLEIQSLKSALDCEEEKSDQLAEFLQNKVKRTERNLTAAAIITGATVSLGIGAILLADIPGDAHEYIGIVGGLIEVVLGLKILNLDRKIAIEHPNNILRDIYYNEEKPYYFPQSVWYYFNKPREESELKSLRELLLERWDAYILNDVEDSIYLSNGGAYSAEMLANRANMLDQLDAQLSLINQDLLHLLNQVDDIIYFSNK